MIKLLSVAIFAGLFFASQARPEPNTPLPEVEASQESPEPNTPLPEVEDSLVSYEPNTPLPEVEDSQASNEPNTTMLEVPASQASIESNTNLPDVPDKFIKQCWTQWYDRDDPSGTGDWEILSSLRKENPGKICPKPAAIDVQTLSGLSMAATGDVIYRSDTTTGFICRNQDQRRMKMCKDYRVRFSCPPSYCVIQGCWTQWYDRDNPSGTGDWETLSSLRKENPGKICPEPAAIEVQTLSGLSVAATGDVIYRSDTTTGFICRNKEQPNWKMCNDYRVRFICPPSYCAIQVCWTQWFDRDDPSGTGDYETLSELQKENPGKICPKPTAIEVQTLSGLSMAAAGDVIYRSDTITGFVCRNKEQPNGKMCNDYRVRFICPPSYCG